MQPGLYLQSLGELGARLVTKASGWFDGSAAGVRTAGGPAGQPPAPAGAVTHDPSIIQLYYTVEALKQDNNSIILQFVSALPGEGTSTIARAFAGVAASAGAKGVLLVDAAPGEVESAGRKPTLIDAYKQGKPRSDAITHSARAQNLQAARLSSQPNPMIEIDSGDMTQLFSELRQEFSLIIFDSGAATQTPDAIALSRYCDGTVLVVRAAYSSPSVIGVVQKNIQLVGGEIVGVVLNRHKNYIPAWLDHALFPEAAGEGV